MLILSTQHSSLGTKKKINPDGRFLFYLFFWKIKIKNLNLRNEFKSIWNCFTCNEDFSSSWSWLKFILNHGKTVLLLVFYNVKCHLESHILKFLIGFKFHFLVALKKRFDLQSTFCLTQHRLAFNIDVNFDDWLFCFNTQQDFIVLHFHFPRTNSSGHTRCQSAENKLSEPKSLKKNPSKNNMRYRCTRPQEFALKIFQHIKISQLHRVELLSHNTPRRYILNLGSIIL